MTIPTLRFEMTRRASSACLDTLVATETSTNRLFIWVTLRLAVAVREDTILAHKVVVVFFNRRIKVIIIIFFIIEIIVTIFYWEATVVCTIGPFDWKATVMCIFFGCVVCSTAVASTLCKNRWIVGGIQERLCCESYQNNM